MNQIYIGNLAYSTKENELRTLFADCGTVTDARIIRDKRTRRSRGYAFVEFKDAADAERAISACDGQEFKGRQLRVSLAKPDARNDEPTSERSPSKGFFSWLTSLFS